MVELGDTQRMGLLIGAAAILIFVVVNMAGLLGGGDEKLFIIDLIGIGSMDAMRPDTGFSTQDIVGLLVAAALGALYFLSAEEELDWEALLGDDDDEEEGKISSPSVQEQPFRLSLRGFLVQGISSNLYPNSHFFSPSATSSSNGVISGFAYRTESSIAILGQAVLTKASTG